jgi:hypothetical protein
MQLFRLVRHPTRAIRIALLGLLLAFGLNAFAHSNHQHDNDGVGTTTVHAACGYCATFTPFIDAKQSSPVDVVALEAPFSSPVSETALVVRPTASAIQPRGPPRN